MILAIDPSINETGWAYGTGDLHKDSGVIRTRGTTDAEKLNDLAVELQDVFYRAEECASGLPVKLSVEVPEGFTYGRSSRNGKSLNARSLMTLSRAIGVVLFLGKKYGFDVVEVPASWKGMVGKRTVQAMTGCTNHNEADAVMLYRWANAHRID